MTDEIEKLIAKHFGLEKVYEDEHLISDLGGDALDVIELVMKLEEKYDIAIHDVEIDHLHTVQDVYNCVNEKLSFNV